MRGGRPERSLGLLERGRRLTGRRAGISPPLVNHWSTSWVVLNLFGALFIDKFRFFRL